MKDVHYTARINAPKEKVWDVMLGEDTYRTWSKVFMPGSYYSGTWEKDSTMRFLAPDEHGTESGMLARIVENKPYEFISMEHLSEIRDKEEIPFNTEGGSFENYTFTEENGVTEVTVDLLNLPDEWIPMMGDLWPKALHILKELAEA